MRQQNEQLQKPGFVTDPQSGKVYNLTAFFKYLSDDGFPLEELHLQIMDAVYDIVQAADFKHTPQRDIKNVCFLLSRLDTLLRPMVLFNPDPVV